MRSIVEDSQFEWEDSDHEPERWFARLRRTSADIDADKATFLFADDTDGRRYGYRWWLHNAYEYRDALADPREALVLFGAHLEEQVSGCELEEGWTYRASPPDREGVQWFGEDPPTPSRELDSVKLRLRDVLYDHMAKWRDSDQRPKRRFSQLEMVFATADHDAVTFVLADREGRQYGYRWQLSDDITADPDRAASLFAANLREDVTRLGHGGPDADRIRWFNSLPKFLYDGVSHSRRRSLICLLGPTMTTLRSSTRAP